MGPSVQRLGDLLAAQCPRRATPERWREGPIDASQIHHAQMQPGAERFFRDKKPGRIMPRPESNSLPIGKSFFAFSMSWGILPV
jgi:hypothetical protein